MKNVSLLLTALLITLALNTSVLAKKNILQPAQLNKLLSDSTFKVTDYHSNKKDKKYQSYRAYASEMGGLRMFYDDGASDTRTWSVQSDGTLCISRASTSKRGAGYCGFLESDGGGTYKLFRARGGKKGKLLFEFSNFKKGNQLK